VAVAEVNNDGNLLNHFYITKSRMMNANSNKRNYDIYNLAKEVVDYAQKVNKPIIIERLNFKRRKNHGSKLNRIFSNFCHSKILNAIERKAVKNNIVIKKINPAFTSILGDLKYKSMYNLDTHTSAALIIARRGMNIKEKLNYDFQVNESGVILNHEGRGITKELTYNAWNYLQVFLAKPYSHKVNIGSERKINSP